MFGPGITTDRNQSMESRLHVLDCHYAILLMKHTLVIPKILYILRTAPFFLSSTLAVFDRELQSLLSEVLNINFVNDAVWTQATLQVKNGGIGLCSAVQLAPSAFLASAATCTNLITTILHSSSPAHQLNITGVDEALSEWKKDHNLSPPSPSKASKQKAWDIPHVEETYTSLLQRARVHGPDYLLQQPRNLEHGLMLCQYLPLVCVWIINLFALP